MLGKGVFSCMSSCLLPPHGMYKWNLLISQFSPKRIHKKGEGARCQWNSAPEENWILLSLARHPTAKEKSADHVRYLWLRDELRPFSTTARTTVPSNICILHIFLLNNQKLFFHEKRCVRWCYWNWSNCLWQFQRLQITMRWYIESERSSSLHTHGI